LFFNFVLQSTVKRNLKGKPKTYFTGILPPFMQGFMPLVGSPFYKTMTESIFAKP